MYSYYSQKVVEHFLHPKHWGKMKNPSGAADTENLACGDIMKIYIKVKKKDKNEYIKDVRFETMGCGTAIASSDMLCSLAQGKTLDQAKKIDFNQILKKMGEVPPQKIHCAHLAEKALKMAIEDYEKKEEVIP